MAGELPVPACDLRSALCAVCCKAIMLSRLFTNDTLHIVNVEIASECPGQMYLKAVKAVLSISRSRTPSIVIPLCYKFITHLCFSQSTDHAATSTDQPCLSAAVSLCCNLSYNSK